MTSFIIVSSDKEKRETYSQKFCDEKHIDPFDRTLLTLPTEETTKKTTLKQSIGIEEIKQFQQKLFLRPLRSEYKAVIIYDAQTLTTEAQNAMLKILEEPPEQTLIILTAESTESMLPTILSRCSIITLEEEKKNVSNADKEEVSSIIRLLPNMSISQALMVAEKWSKSKQDALHYLEMIIITLREIYLVNASDRVIPIQLRSLQETHTLIKTTNVNVRMALEQLFLSMNNE